MLSAADSEVIRRDGALLGLPLLLDASALLDLIHRKLPQSELGSIQQTYLRYKPGTSCLGGYRMQIAQQWVDLHARAVRPGKGSKLPKLVGQPAIAHGQLPGRLVCDELALVVSLFPNDRRLPSLAQLADGESRYELLSRLFPDRPQWWGGTTHSLRYKPERRYVAELRGEDGPRAVLKFYTQGEFQPNVASSLQASNLLRLPRRIGRSNRHRVLAFRWRAGPLLSELAPSIPAALQACARVGAALAELHSQGGVQLKLVTRSDEAERLRQGAKDLARLYPPIAPRGTMLAKLLASRLLELPPTQQPIHGDFYAEQVIVTENGASLLDFDEAVRSDPMRDLGNFVAHLRRNVLRGVISDEGLERLQTSLLAGYSSAGGEYDPARFNLYIAIGLFDRVLQPFRQREDNWPQQIEALLQTAESLVKDSPSSPSTARRQGSTHTHVIDPFGAAYDDKMPFLAAAMNPTAATHELSRCFAGLLGSADSVDLRTIRVMRCKPQRRCLIEYVLELAPTGDLPRWLTILGKARAKGVSHNNFELLRSLWNSGFQDTSPDGTSIPEPLGIVDAWQMWFQRKAPGEPATSLLLRADGAALARRIAEALQKLHATPVKPAGQHELEDELRILDERLTLLAHTRPEWKPRLETVLHACRELAAGMPRPATTSCIHRDFYPDQVLVDGPRLFLVDFDLACRGDPALDAGNFIGHLIEQGLRNETQADALSQVAQAFTGHFLQLSPHISAEAVQGYTTLTLVRHIALSTQFADRRQTTGRLIDLCECRLVSDGRRIDRNSQRRAR